MTRVAWITGIIGYEDAYLTHLLLNKGYVVRYSMTEFVREWERPERS